MKSYTILCEKWMNFDENSMKNLRDKNKIMKIYQTFAIRVQLLELTQIVGKHK